MGFSFLILIKFFKNQFTNSKEKLTEFKIDKDTHFKIFKYLYEMYKINKDQVLYEFNEITYIDVKGMLVIKINPIMMYDSKDLLVSKENLYLGKIYADGCEFSYQNDLPNLLFINDSYIHLE